MVRTTVARLPTTPGVYRFRDTLNRAIYIGRAVNLRRRVASYWTSPLRMTPRIARIEAVVCASEHEAAWLERNLLEQSKPRWNRTAGGQEVPVWLRVDDQTASPGVTVVHSVEAGARVRHFGPYLGGLKVRTAATALHRALPLAYSGEKLTGFERDMAQRLGVSPDNHAALAERLVAVLERDSAAIAALDLTLIGLRDAAAESLHFERASQIQAELDAVAWVVAEQNVTASTAGDFDVNGWADGILVRFEVRGGRMSHWRQQPCSAASARRFLAKTPPHWIEFAQRNAQLAVRLAGP